MDEARLLPGGHIYTADEIWEEPNAKDLDWRCLGCEKALTPWAWEKKAPPFRVRAHFKARQGHSKECKIDGLEIILTKNTKQTIQARQGFTSLIPSLVYFPDKRPVIGSKTPSNPPTQGGNSTYTHGQYCDGIDERPTHQRWGRSLYTVACCHSRMSVPARKYYQLSVEGCDGSTYFEVFYPLYDLKPGESVRSISRKVFYGTLLFNQTLKSDAEVGPQIELLAGRKNLNSMRRNPPFSVSVDWRGWSEQQKTTFRKQFESQLAEISDCYKRAKLNGKPRPTARLYFLGSQSSDPFKFSVDDLRKLCVVFPILPDIATEEAALVEELRQEHARTSILICNQGPISTVNAEAERRPPILPSIIPQPPSLRGGMLPVKANEAQRSLHSSSLHASSDLPADRSAGAPKVPQPYTRDFPVPPRQETPHKEPLSNISRIWKAFRFFVAYLAK